MAKKVQIMSNPKQWQVVDGVEVLVDVPTEDLDPMTSSECVEIEGHRTLEETISQDNAFTPEITETKIMTKVGGDYHENVMDGAYEKAILYGNTQVNLVESVTTGSKYIPQTFTSFQKNERKVSKFDSNATNQVAPLIKGVTMVNLCQETSKALQCGYTLAVANHNAKPNTKYTLKLKFTTKNRDKGFMIQSYGYNDSGTWGYLEINRTMSNLGDEVVTTFTTHEKADTIIIYNYPNFCTDDTETIRLDDIMVFEGDVADMEIPFFKSMRSVELVKPLTNLFTDDLRWGNQGTITYTNSGGNVTVSSTSIGTWSGITFYFDNKLKPNTKYLVMWDSLSQTQTATDSKSIIAVYDVSGNTNIGTANNKTECPTIRSILFDTTGRNYTNIGLRIHSTLTNSETGTTTVTGLRVFEWDDSLRTLDLQTIGYFSGTKNVCQHVFKTESKNLYPHGEISYTSHLTNIDVWFDSKGTSHMHGDVAQKSKARFLLQKGTYTITTGVWANVAACQIVDDKEQIIIKLDSGKRNHAFTLLQDTYCTLRFKVAELEVWANIKNIQIERGDTATTYQEYNGRAYISDCKDEIILRSLPNGVCDTFNTQTGELVQNVWNATYDGDTSKYTYFNYETAVSEDESYTVNETSAYFQLKQSTVGFGRAWDYNAIPNMICDRLKVCSRLDCQQTTENSVCLYNNGAIGIRVKGIKTTSELSVYLNENPITFQYQTQEPTIKTLPITTQIYNTYTNTITSMGNNLGAFSYHSINDFMMVGNLSPVPAIVEPITILPYNVRLKENTNYTIKYNRGNSSSMTFDLGGTSVTQSTSTGTNSVQEELLIKTPTSMLSHSQLRLSGNGYAYNFVIVEGDMRGKELPYFEGMKDVKMPIVRNVSKNLLDESSMFIDRQSDITLRYYKAFPCKPNTRYYFFADKGESQCNWYEASHREATVQKDAKDLVYIGYTNQIKTTSTCKYLIIYMGCTPDIDPYTIKTRVYEELVNETITNSTPYQQHRENEVCIVQGEYPITSEMIEQGGFTTANGTKTTYETMKYGEENASYLKRLRSKDLIPVKPNTTYAFTHPFSKFAYNVYQWNGNKQFINETSQYFASGQIETITTTADTQYIHFLISKHETSQTIAVAEYDWSQFHMYELDSTIQLRSLPNGVKDELNLLTGEYIQRVGEVVLGEMENWSIDNTASESTVNTNIFYTGKHDDFKPLSTTSREKGLVCDKFNIVAGLYSTDVEGVMINTDPRAYIRLNKSVAPDVSSLITYLKTNPVTVQYELAEPIISYPRIVSNTEEREVGVKLPNGVCNTYNPSTGITTVRVGYVEFDGSADEAWTHRTDYKLSTWSMFNIPSDYAVPTQSSSNINVICDSLPSDYEQWNNGGESITVFKLPTRFSVTYKATKINSIDAFRTHLSQNPLKVWYELKYPQIQPDIVLPNGVHDEYNPETGVYTKRVGFIEFDGSADELWSPEIVSGNSTHCYGSIHIDGTISPEMKHMANSDEVYILSDTFKTVSRNNFRYDSSEIYVWTGRTVYLNMPQTNLGAINSQEWRKYLSQNPIKLWYELQTPITYQLTPYFGLPTPYAYEDGHLIMESAYPDVTLPPEFSYKLVANRTGQIVSNNKKLQQHTSRLTNLEAIIVEATIESLFTREMQKFEFELMSIQLVDLGE